MNLALIFGLFFPRVAAIIVWLFTGSMLVGNWLLALLGFIFLPYTLLAVMASSYWFAGGMNLVSTLLVILGLMADLGLFGFYRRHAIK